MSRINFNSVVQLQELLVQTVVHHRGHQLRRKALAAGEIRAAHVADEERVAGQDLLRLIRRFRSR